MRIAVGICRIVVGVLFIISGLIKLNDPVGFSFKLEEYFSAEVLNMEWLIPYALLLAVIVVIAEVMLGVMIVLGYAVRLTLWSLLLMIVFFTFLTFYSAYFNKVTDCGCFGDALKLTPWESFWKDVILLALILFLIYGRKYIQPFFTVNIRSILVFASLVGCLGLAYHVLEHLPVVDFRPYKIGANIPEGMSIPPGAPEPVFEYRWLFTQNGEEETVVTNGDYPSHPGELLEVKTKEIQAGYEPPIHDFSMERNGEDHTEQLMQVPRMLVIIAYNLENTEMEGYYGVRQLVQQARSKGVRVIGMSASSQDETTAFSQQNSLELDFYFCDQTTLKTIVRSNPGILEIRNGTITQKLHWNDAAKFQLEP
ncbi:BT_3928 family protein [Aureitalea marina]|uniref:DoxX family protein n=1 Tax=Aureitalea marina TaxID=930804 RepID=A0A2S7KMG9_9FLAO|nr:BT_3928 family protein [Aureitalea marina]PQB03791.1 DoxX family protein [Aureitalea marina]